MKLLTKHTDYALRALLYLGKKEGGLASSREIAQENGIPLAFIRRLLQTLARKGLVTSKEGAGGGVKLAVAANNINLLSVMRLMQGEFSLSQCLFRGNACVNRKHCVVRKRIKGIEKKILKEFEAVTLTALISDSKKNL